VWGHAPASMHLGARLGSTSRRNEEKMPRKEFRRAKAMPLVQYWTGITVSAILALNLGQA